MSNTFFDRIDGTLSTLVNEVYTDYPVKLDIEGKRLFGSGGVEDEAISRVTLASHVPDGSPYTLRYSYHGKRHEQIGLRVNGGVLLSG
jgi:hypothetical protein